MPKTDDQRSVAVTFVAVCGACCHTRHLHSKHPLSMRACYAGLCGCSGWVGEPLHTSRPFRHRSKRVVRADDIGEMSSRLSIRPCEVDGIRLDQHPRCPACFMLYGVEHLAFEERPGQCNICVAEKARQWERKQPRVVMVRVS